MGTSKSNLFTPTQNELARLAKALSHPARLAIVEFLAKQNACFTGDLVAEIGLAQATVSQHLAELKEAGILKGSIEGVRVSYCIDAERWQVMREQFERLFERVPSAAPLGCC
ncbi:MAG: metalloregulator ArsR/SmtB family transcription factor [Schleiferiaceae bacterium]